MTHGRNRRKTFGSQGPRGQSGHWDTGQNKAAKPSLASPALQRRPQVNQRKRSQQRTSSSAAPHHHAGPSSTLVSDTTMTPWAGLALSESSFASIALPPPPRAPPLPPPPPPAPQPTPSTSYHGRQEDEEEVSSSSFNSEAPSPPGAVPQDSDGVGVGRGLRARRRLMPQRRVPRPPRLPPLRPVTNLSFSRSFTFSFFELPLHQSPRCRAERARNLLLLLRQIHF